jgi:trans-aconitate methyltransferase
MTTRTKVWDTDKEAKRYDAAFYDKHTKYYEKGLKSFQDFIINECSAQSLADVGCGMGDWSAPLQEKIPVLGIDFSVGAVEKQQLKQENFLQHDLTHPLSKTEKKDVVSSLEVYEHILAEHEDTYLANLLSFDPRILILSCAPPGQWGRGHHNPCTPDHVTAKMLERGYVPELVLTQKFSKLKGLASFYRKNTIVFVKSPEAQ